MDLDKIKESIINWNLLLIGNKNKRYYTDNEDELKSIFHLIDWYIEMARRDINWCGHVEYENKKYLKESCKIIETLFKHIYCLDLKNREELKKYKRTIRTLYKTNFVKQLPYNPDICIL